MFFKRTTAISPAIHPDADISPARPAKGSGTATPTAFNDTFVVGSQDVAQKDILNYIRGKCLQVLGQDYYYAYVYKNGRLSFIATRSDKHITGATTVFAPAFFAEGKFLYKHGSRYFVVANEKGTLEWLLCMTPPVDDYTEVFDGPAVLPKGTPSTMKFQWSLSHRHFLTDLALTGVVLISLFYYGTSLNDYNAVQKKADAIRSQETAAANKPKPQTTTLDLAELITDMRHKIEPYEGLINEIKIDRGAVLCTLGFPHENYARMFISKTGGKYENGKVLLGFNMPGGGSNDPGNQSGKKQEGGVASGKPVDAKASQPGTVQAGAGK